MKIFSSILFLGVFAATSVASGDGTGIWIDPAGDAVFRHTDAGANGAIPPGIDPIDLLRVEVNGWTTPTPTTNPYNGSVAQNASLMRILIRFDGVVSPPGPLGFGETGGQFDPLRFGDRPVYGTIEFDTDDRKNSGGELGELALLRYLANVGRFGALPEGSIGERAARGGDDLDMNFWTSPQYERTGGEFAFVMCGCWVPQIVSQDGDMDSRFDAGETWIVNGRFFQRVESFAQVSGFFGGSDFGMWDPPVDVRWSHSITEDETTIELVFPLRMAGAAALRGEPQQQMNLSLFDHTCMAEAMVDIIETSEYASGPLLELMEDWEGRDYDDYLSPEEWPTTALIGTAYVVPETDARFVWTDVGFGERLGDCTGDGLSSSADQSVVESFIAANDGGADDCDGTTNGSVAVCLHARNFSLYDFDADGVVDACDQITLGRGADLNSDGLLDFFDVLMFLQWFSTQDERADLDGSQSFDFFDVLTFLQRFSAGCP